jgi:hypothetical protein
MKAKSSSNQASLESRIADLEFNVERISGTLYDLIATFQGIGDPPCPPMCGSLATGAKQTAKKRTSKKKRS